MKTIKKESVRVPLWVALIQKVRDLFLVAAFLTKLQINLMHANV